MSRIADMFAVATWVALILHLFGIHPLLVYLGSMFAAALVHLATSGLED